MFLKILLFKKIFIVIFILGIGVFFSDTTLALQNEEVLHFEMKKENISPDSPFLDPSPRIDSQAAVYEKKCFSLPQVWWVFLLATYIFLLIFNLTYEFDKNQKPRFFWETLYTILIIWTWHKFDACRQFEWFFQLIVIEGIIIYSFYLYFLKQKSLFSDGNIQKKEIEEEKTARLPFE